MEEHASEQAYVWITSAGAPRSTTSCYHRRCTARYNRLVPHRFAPRYQTKPALFPPYSGVVLQIPVSRVEDAERAGDTGGKESEGRLECGLGQRLPSYQHLRGRARASGRRG
eukprot:1163664-Rhodomonas_salina.1